MTMRISWLCEVIKSIIKRVYCTTSVLVELTFLPQVVLVPQKKALEIIGGMPYCPTNCIKANKALRVTMKISH